MKNNDQKTKIESEDDLFVKEYLIIIVGIKLYIRVLVFGIKVISIVRESLYFRVIHSTLLVFVLVLLILSDHNHVFYSEANLSIQ